MVSLRSPGMSERRLLETSAALAETAAWSDVWDHLEKCLEALERDWLDNQKRPLDEYLPTGDAILRQTVLFELVKLDLEFQWKDGCRPELIEYCERYPELGEPAELPADLVYEAWHVARRHDAACEVDAFCREFPQQRSTVLRLAQLGEISARVLPVTQELAPEAHVGARLGDFQITALLGEGSFSKVFLARQISLGREVALKVSADATHEAMTLARLEHDHIVRVFSESVDPETELRLLCMQFVAGPTLATIIRWRKDHPCESWNGRLLIEAIDALSTRPVAFQKAALEDREMLRRADLVEAVCWLGARLADALAFAHCHEHPVIHRDIKPANILLDQYGRPYLSDFNLSRAAGHAEGVFGGSCGYMAPEHLDAFNSPDDPNRDAVDARSDLYSLGIVLYELLVGRRPFPDPTAGGNREEILRQLAEVRRQGAPDPRDANPAVSPALGRIVRTCLEPDPERRFPSASELAAALDAARELHGMESDMPRAGWLTRTTLKRPFEVVSVLVFLPHIVGVLLNVGYVTAFFREHFTQHQLNVYIAAGSGYALLSFSLTGVISWRLTIPKQIAWTKFLRGQDVTSAEFLAARRRVVKMPVWGAWVSLAGWLPGALVVPAALWAVADPLPAPMLMHVFFLYTISGLISLAYTYFASEFVDLRAGYLLFLMEARHPRVTARRELLTVGRRIRLFHYLAVLIPLAAALLMVLAGPSGGDDSVVVFRWLMGVVLVLSVLGLSVAGVAAATLHQILAALTGLDPRQGKGLTPSQRFAPLPTTLAQEATPGR